MDDDVETIVEAFRLLDSDTYEQALEIVDENFEMVTTPEVASEPGLYTGPDGVRRWWESFLDAMDYVRLDVEEVHPVGDGRAILEFQIRARGRSSGIEAAQRAVGLATARDGKITRLEFFTELGPAREAAGLPPR
jgi:ketosteroid isomerase-like protein